MRVLEHINDIKAVIRTQKTAGRSIGFIPTMGYLHEGHISLIKASKTENDFTIMSIFVNPSQFGPGEDFNKYPRDMARDIRMAEEAGVDIIFAPAAQEMYPSGYKTYIDVSDIAGVLCGKSRLGHFRGVATVVCKLFHIIQPDKAYFGQKDAQQIVVIKRMVKDLNIGIDIITCHIIRESDGLAMSSRNVYLNPEERKAALILFRSLFEVEEMIRQGERSKETIQKYILGKIAAEELANIDYVEVVDAENLQDISTISNKVLVALAVKFGNTRLIDNIIVEVGK